MRISGIKPLGVNTAGGLKLSASVATIVTWVTEAGNLGSPYQGQSFQRTFVATSNDASTVTYSVVGGNLPQGMALDPNTGVLTGTPLGPSALYSFTVQAQAGPGRASRTFSIAVKSLNIIWNTGTTLNANGGHPFYQAISATASNSAQVFLSVVSGTMPTGVSLSPTGVVSGRPNNTTGTYTFTIRATVDGFAVTEDRVFTFNVVADAVVWSTAGGNLGTVLGGKSFTRTLTATSDPGDTITYTVRNGLLPQGLTLNSATGVISGTAGNFGGLQSFTIRASDGVIFADRDFSITVDEDVISWITPSGSLGTYLGGSVFNATFQAVSDNGESVTYAVVAGNVPSGLSLSSSGVLTGTVGNIDGLYSFTIRASSPVSSSSRTFSITVSRDNIMWQTTSTLLVDGDVENEVQLRATSTSARTISYSRQSGALPTGMSLASTGLISGTPTVPGVHTMTARADNGIASSDKTFSINVNAAPIWETPAGVLGTTNSAQQFRFTLLAVDPDGIAAYTVESGNLPQDGIQLDPINGNLSGAFGLPPEFTPPTWNTDRALGTVNEGNTSTLAVSASPASGRAVRAYSLVTGQLPAGLGLAPSSGMITGTFGSELARGIDPDVHLTPKPTWVSNSSLGTHNENEVLSESLSATALLGNAISTYAVISGALPLGVSLNIETGTLSGTLIDQAPVRHTGQLTNDPIWISNSGSLGIYEEDIDLTFTLTANAAAGRTLKYTLEDGHLPAGMNIASNGVVSGQTSNDNSFFLDPDVFKLPVPVWSTLTDLGTISEGGVVSRSLTAAPMRGNATSYAIVDGDLPWGLSLAANTGLLSGTILNQNPFRKPDEHFGNPTWMTGNALGTFEEEVSISLTVSANPTSGRTVRYSQVSGHLPAGVALASNGAITGITDNANSPTLDPDVHLTPKPTWTTATALGSINEGSLFSSTLVAAPVRGNAVVSYALVNGSMPWGLSLIANTGELSGTVGNQNPTRLPADYTTGPVWSTAASLGTVEEEMSVTRTLVAPSTGRSVRYSVLSGHLPGGLALEANGVLSGVTGNENGFGADADVQFVPKPTWSTVAGSIGTFNEGGAVSTTLAATALRGSAMSSFAIVSGVLPPGISLANTGTISGTLGDQNPIRDASGLTNAPTWSTAAGSLGTFTTSSSVNVSVAATASSSRTLRAYRSLSLLPIGLVLNTATGAITGTPDAVAVGRTFTFTVRALDNLGAYSDRSFSITIQ